MIYDIRGDTQETKQAVSSSRIEPYKGANRGEKDYYVDGDILVIGSIPPWSLVTEAYARMDERFEALATIDFGVPIWANDEIVGINVLDTIPADSQGILYKLDLDVSTLDTASTIVGTHLLSKKGPQPIVVRLNLPTNDIIGKADFIIPFTSYGITTGAYTS